MPTIQRRSILLALLGLALSIALWAFLSRILVTRELHAAFHADGATGEWSLWWKRPGDAGFHGRWADQAAHARTTLALEIEPSGVARDPANEGFAYELWVYAVDPIAPRAVDLDVKAAIRTLPAADLHGKWFNFEQGPGVVYSGSGKGLMRLEAPAGGLVLAMAKVPRGGPVTLRYAGQELTLDLYAPSIERIEVRLDDPHWSSAGRIELTEPLPAYAIEDVRLAWHGFAAPRLDSAAASLSMFGWEVARRPMSAGGEITHTPEPVAPDFPEAAARQVSPQREWHMIALRGAIGLPFAAHALGVLACAVIVTIVGALGWLGARLARSARAARVRPVWSLAALGLVAAAALCIARRAPLFITSDGVVYIDGAVALVEDGSMARFVPFKAPGLTFITALGLGLAGDFEAGVRWIHAACTIASGILAWAFARRAVARWAGPVAAILVGCSPLTLTYQAYLLRECASITILCAVAFAFALRTPGVLGQRARPLAGAILLGLLCGLGSLLRENLQLLVVLAPLLMLVLERRALSFGVRGVHAVACLVLALALVVPYVVRMERVHGNLGIVTPKLQYNRAIAAHQNGLVDFGDAALFDRGLHRTSREPESTDGTWGGALTEYDFVLRSLERALSRGESGETTVPRLPPEAAPRVVVKPTIDVAELRRREAIYERIVDEAVARRPAKAFGAMARALGIQLGLVVVYDPVAAANEWYARPLRGEPFASSTNVQVDIPAMLEAQPGCITPRTRELIQNAERGTTPLSSGAAPGAGTPGLGVGPWFNEAFWVWRLVNPALGALALAGGVVAIARALRRRSIEDEPGRAASGALAACALILLTQALSAAVVVMTPVDRFGVPLLALQAPLALYALGAICGASRPTPRCRHPNP